MRLLAEVVCVCSVYGFASQMSELVSLVTRLLVSCGEVPTSVVSHLRLQAQLVFVHVDR